MSLEVKMKSKGVLAVDYESLLFVNDFLTLLGQALYNFFLLLVFKNSL